MSFGGWSIDVSLFNWLENNLEKGKILLEIGSGQSTFALCKIWDVYSIEEDIDWIDKYHNKYIYAPIKENWYDLNIVKSNIPKSVDAILIDGPAHGDRNGFFENINIFLNLNPDILVFDDLEREIDYNCYISIVNYLKTNNINIEYDIVTVYKKFGFIKIKK